MKGIQNTKAYLEEQRNDLTQRCTVKKKDTSSKELRKSNLPGVILFN